MADIDLLMCLFIPFLAVIYVNVSSTAILYITCMNYFYISSILMNWVPYYFPPKLISRRSTHFPKFSLMVLVLVLSHSLVSVYLDYAVSLSLSTGASWSLM